jgi:phytoene dehydrogenase-like protein
MGVLMPPTPTELDGIVIGAGQQGLVLSAYLARAGLRVAVFERRPEEGGAMNTWESAPGVFHNLATHFKMHDGPVLSDLELDRYGVSFHFPKVKTVLLGDDGEEPLVHYEDWERTAQSLAKFSEKDAETYRRMAPVWNDWYERFVLPELYHAPEPPEVSEAKIAAAPGGAEYLRAKAMAPEDYFEEVFEHPRARALVLWISGVSTYRSERPGVSTMGMHAFLSWLIRRTGLARGGSRQFARGLTRVITSNGSQVFTDEHVDRIMVEDGRATGVHLASGRTMRASKFVASAVDVKQTLLQLVEPGHVDEQLLDKIRAFRLDRSALFGVHLVLRERIRYRAEGLNPDVALGMRFLAGVEAVDDLIREKRAAESGELVAGRLIVMPGQPSVLDPTMAREGVATAYAWTMVPTRIHHGALETWDDVAEGIADRVIESWAQAAENLTLDNILHRRISTPLDLQRSFINMLDGGLNMGELSPDQTGINRPTRELSQYATPIAGLYLAGSSSHPGGQLTGAPGYNAARRIVEDLGITPWWPAYRELGEASAVG